LSLKNILLGLVLLMGNGALSGEAGLPGKGTLPGKGALPEKGTVTGEAVLSGKGTLSGKGALSGDAALPGKGALSEKRTLSGNAAQTGEIELPPSSILDGPQSGKKAEKINEEAVLSYEDFVAVVTKIRENPNQITSEYDLDQMQKEMKGKFFLFRDTVRVKTDPFVSEEKGFWFTPSPVIESFLVMPREFRREYGAIQIHDYVTAKAKLIEIGKICRFEAAQVERVDPYDPSAQFEDFTAFIERFKGLKSTMPYAEYKALQKRETDELEGALGHVTGQMISLKRNKENDYVMVLDVGGITVRVVCHPSYLSVLDGLEIHSRVKMAVIMERSDLRDGYFMTRGCMVPLRTKTP